MNTTETVQIQMINVSELTKQLNERLAELNNQQREEATKVTLYRKELEKSSWLKMTPKEKEEKIQLASEKLNQIIAAKMEVYTIIKIIEKSYVGENYGKL